MMKKISTEEEARAALAERRRLARVEAERQAELERQRLEAEQLAEEQRIAEEEEQQRRLEEDTMRMVEEQRRAEELRLTQAIQVIVIKYNSILSCFYLAHCCFPGSRSARRRRASAARGRRATEN